MNRGVRAILPRSISRFNPRSLGLGAVRIAWVVLAVSLPTVPTAVGAGGPEQLVDSQMRARRARVGLQPATAKLSQFDAALGRSAPTSLNVLVVGCDFSDSLMVGRDLTQFPDHPAQRRQSQLIPGTDIPVFAAHDAAFFAVQMQRVDDYFRTVSFGQFDLQWRVHDEIVNLDHPMGYYGDADSSGVRVVEMTQQVIDAIDADVDFTGIDTIILIHAGAGKESDLGGDSPAQIFSNYLDRRDFEAALASGHLQEPVLRSAEGPLEHALIWPESETQDPPTGNPRAGFLDVRGVYCFELGLRMGMLSLADFTPGNFPDSQGIGEFGLMGYGLFTGLGIVPSAPSAINRMLMGWVSAVEVSSDGDLRIGAMGADGAAVSDTLLVRVPINDREYWLIEYRLQDPDGDLFYSFDDANDNNVPDYFDADSDSLDGRPTSPYDPANDEWENELGAEWDWFMSENNLRSFDGCDRAGGSGLYIWHVDERVIQDALFAGTNTINADATRKGVDCEEADGIQDLDDLTGGYLILGGDDDSWRGEGSSEFGPSTLPSTLSNDGVPTGITIGDIEAVAIERFPMVNGFCTGFLYRPALRFTIRFGATDSAPREIGRVRLVDFATTGDLRVADLGTSPGDPALDGSDEVIALADDGRVMIWTTAGAAWSSAPGEAPATLARQDDGSEWSGAPALLDLDLDGRPEVVAASTLGVLAFSVADGSVVSPRDSAPGSALIEAEAGRSVVGPFRVLREGIGPGSLGAVFVADDDSYSLSILRRIPGELDPLAIETESAWTADGAMSDDWFVVQPVGTEARIGVVLEDSMSSRIVARSGLLATVDRSVEAPSPARSHVTAVVSFGDSPAALWVDGSGSLRIDGLDADGPDRRALESGAVASSAAIAPIAQGAEVVIALALDGDLWVFDSNLRVRTGFPYRPIRSGVDGLSGPAAVAPILVDLDGDGRVEVLWHEPAGAIHAVDLRGRLLGGWPIAGPAEPISSPAVGDFDGDGSLDLVVVGRFDQLVSIDAPQQAFESVSLGDIRFYELGVAASTYAPWSQGDGGVTNLSSAELSAGSAAAPVVSNLVVYPNPAIGATARVRYRVQETTDVRVDLYTLEGERVLQVGPFTTPGGTTFEEILDIGDLVSGLYLCTVEAGGRRERTVLTIVR